MTEPKKINLGAGRGGRTNTGRPKGVPNSRFGVKKQLKLKSTMHALELTKDGDILPLAVLVEAMRFHYYRHKEDPVVNFADLKCAADYAKDAAPYLHPRLASTEIKGDPTKPITPPNVYISFGDPTDGIKIDNTSSVQSAVPAKTPQSL